MKKLLASCSSLLAVALLAFGFSRAASSLDQICRDQPATDQMALAAVPCTSPCPCPFQLA